MFHTLSNVQRGDAIPLQQYIDNRDGRLRVGLQSLILTVGWYNVEEVSFLEWNRDNPLTKLIKVPPGLYGFDWLKAVLESGESDVQLMVNPVNGIVKLTIGSGWELKIPHSIVALLGIADTWGDRWIGDGTYVGERSLDFAMPKGVYLHLDQMNTSANYVDGAPSTLLQVIPAGRSRFGAIEDLHFDRPLFKHLQGGTIGELKLTLRDKKNRPIENNGLAVIATLEISEG